MGTDLSSMFFLLSMDSCPLLLVPLWILPSPQVVPEELSMVLKGVGLWFKLAKLEYSIPRGTGIHSWIVM